MSSFLQQEEEVPCEKFRVAIIGDQRTGKTEILKWFFEGENNHGSIDYEEILVGDFIRESDYVRVEGSLHRFQSAFETNNFREYRKKMFRTKHERKAVLQRKKFNKRYRATISPLFYDIVINEKEDTNNGQNRSQQSKPKAAVQVWDTSGKSSFSRLGLIFEEFRLVDLFFITFSIDDKTTFDNVNKWKEEVVAQLENVGKHRKIPIILIGTKLDKEENRQVTQDRVYDYCRGKAPYGGNITYFEVSSRVPGEGSSVTDIFDEAVKLIEITRTIKDLSEDENGKVKKLSQKQIQSIHTKYEMKNMDNEMNRSCKTCNVM